MSFVIFEIQGYTAKDLMAWDWDELLEEPGVEVNAFDTMEDLERAVTHKMNEETG